MNNDSLNGMRLTSMHKYETLPGQIYETKTQNTWAIFL